MSYEEAYQLYLDRFAREVGTVEEGAFSKYMGGVIRKLSIVEFGAKWRDFEDIRASYEAMLGRGFTIDDVLAKELRERAAELIVDLPDALK